MKNGRKAKMKNNGTKYFCVGSPEHIQHQRQPATATAPGVGSGPHFAFHHPQPEPFTSLHSLADAQSLHVHCHSPLQRGPAPGGRVRLCPLQPQPAAAPAVPADHSAGKPDDEWCNASMEGWPDRFLKSWSEICPGRNCFHRFWRKHSTCWYYFGQTFVLVFFL